MAKELNITPVSSSNVCVPNNILVHCGEIYSKFEKDVKKYAPGDWAFFKFNSTIVENLKTLKGSTGNSLYVVAVYQSYFRNCKGLDKIEDITKKIFNKLDSLLESIGSGKKASISTKGLKGLFSKKRSKDKNFEDLYKDFSNIKTNMQTTINKNTINTEFLPNGFNFEILTQPECTHPKDLSGTISKMTTKKELLECLDSRDLKFFLESAGVSTLKGNIPSYGGVVSKFLEDAQIEYTNFYTIQHQFKELYDVKGKAKESDPEDLQDMMDTYQTYSESLDVCKKDLKASWQCLEELSQNIKENWSKKIEKASKDTLAIRDDIKALFDKVRNANLEFRSSAFTNQDSEDTSSYDSMIRMISDVMELACTNISVSQSNISSPICKYDDIAGKLLVLGSNFRNVKRRIRNYIENSVRKDFTNNKNGTEAAISKYNKICKDIRKDYEAISSKINTLSKRELNHIIKCINKKEAEESFNKLKSFTGSIGTALGVSISIAGAIMSCYQKAKTI